MFHAELEFRFPGFMATDYTEDQLAHKLNYVGWVNQREVILAVAGMNGIQDINHVMPAFLQKESGKGGITKEGAQSVMLAVELRVLKGGALNSLPLTMPEIQALSA